MNFTPIDDDKLSGEILYIPDEYAFQTEPRPPFWNSVLVDNLELILDIDGRITGIWGLCPHTRWKSAHLVLPKSRYGGVICEKFATFDSRIPVRIASNWQISFDRKKGWICIGDVHEKCDHIEVVAGLVIAIDNQALHSIWIDVGKLNI